MSEIQELVILVVVCVAGFTALYKILPFKVYGASKPKLSLFPKYIALLANLPNKLREHYKISDLKKLNLAHIHVVRSTEIFQQRQ